jgi:ring-1,2-phenylacetyl-CoA epoxidase subunit PaaD
MVSVEAVRAALAEIPDPELPVVSLVELGVVGDVRVQGRRVSVTLTPTFLGCPALDAMRRAVEAKITELGGEPDVAIATGGDWTADRISTVGREKLQAAGVGPPAPRGDSGPTLVQLQSTAFRCPYCGSKETRLENLFGPTPCRSIRYCDSCRQPFEQFKTI